MKIFLILFLLLSVRLANCQVYVAYNEEKKAQALVPKPVVEAFIKLVPDADSIKWLQISNGETLYEYAVSFRQDYQQGGAVFNANGSAQSYAIRAKIDTLPLNIRRNIIKRLYENQKLSPVAVVFIESDMRKSWPINETRDEKQIVHRSFNIYFFLSEKEARLYQDTYPPSEYCADRFRISEDGKIIKEKAPKFR